MAIMDADVAIEAARAGSDVVRAMYGAPLGRVDKGGGDFATEADIAAERAIAGVIRAARPGDAVVGEESGRQGPRDAARVWLVDPLCGTLNFAARTMLVAVNVALRAGAEVTAAASADPFAGEVFWTGDGAAYVRRDGADERLVPSADSRLVDVDLDSPLADGSGGRGVPPARLLAVEGFAALFRPRVVSTTLALAWVAAGRHAAYVTGADVRDSVHFAAGVALCRSAGCVVTGLDGGPYSGGGGLVAAADPSTHAALVDLVGRAGRAAGGR